LLHLGGSVETALADLELPAQFRRQDRRVRAYSF
jgi:hypothetical protein